MLRGAWTRVRGRERDALFCATDVGFGCAVTRRRFPVGASPTRQPLQPEATGAAMEVNEMAEALQLCCCSRKPINGGLERLLWVMNGGYPKDWMRIVHL